MATSDAANDKEPFPLLNTSLDPFAMDEDSAPRRRRKSSGLGGEIRAGDTGAPAFASSQASLNAGDSFGHYVCLPFPSHLPAHSLAFFFTASLHPIRREPSSHGTH